MTGKKHQRVMYHTDSCTDALGRSFILRSLLSKQYFTDRICENVFRRLINRIRNPIRLSTYIKIKCLLEDVMEID